MQNIEDVAASLEQALLELQNSASLIQNTIQFLNGNTMGYTEQEIFSIVVAKQDATHRFVTDTQISRIGIPPVVSQGVLIGDSTIASTLGQTQISDFIFNYKEIADGYSAINLAVGGQTIAQQQAVWSAYSGKAAIEWIIVEIGLNDCIITGDSSATIIGRYQTLINTINSDKQSGAKVIVATMTPAKQRFIDLLGSTNGAAAYQKWLDLNAAIMGSGSTPITGVDYRLNTHTAALNDGADNLAAAFETSGTTDHIHENNLARGIIADEYKAALSTLGLAIAKPFVTTYQNIYNVLDYGLVGDGITDNTAAFQALITLIGLRGRSAKILAPAGHYIFSGALQQTSTANSQIVYPFNSLDSAGIVIELEGASQPPLQYFTYSLDPTAAQGYTIFESTLTGGTGTASFISSSYEVRDGLNQNNITPNFKNIFFKAPNNPTFTMLNLLNMQANHMEGVHIFGGTLNCANVVQPTHSNAYGLKLADENHTPNTILDNVRIMGFYYGFQMSESVFGKGVRISACYKGIDAIFGYHISVFTDVAIYWTPYGITSTASRNDSINRLRIIGFGMEHHGSSGGASWMDNVYDVDDPSNYLLGDLVYVSVTGGVGNTNNGTSFVKNGGANFLCSPLSSIALGTTVVTPSLVAAEVGTVDASTVVVTISENIKAPNYVSGFTVKKGGVSQTISSGTRQTGNKAKVNLVLSAPIVIGDVVTIEYAKIDGFVENLLGGKLPDVTATTVTNNVGSGGITSVIDNFTGTDGTALTSHTIAPTNTAGATWALGTGAAFDIQGNKLRVITSDSNPVMTATFNATIPDVTASVVISTGTVTQDMALIFRYVDENNYWFALANSSTTTFAIYERTGGTNVERVSVSKTFASSTDYTIQVITNGTSITATIDAGSTLTYTSSAKQTATKYGVWSAGGTAANTGRFDAISVHN